MSTNDCQSSNEKVVGVLGGMGPYAALNFCKQLLDLTPVEKDWEHLRVIIDNNTKIPSRTRAVLCDERSPVPGMIDGINNLAKAGADLVALPCNSAHYFYSQVVPYISIPWVNILSSTVKEVMRRGRVCPLVLGGSVTVIKGLYDSYFSEVVYPESNDVVVNVIEEIKLTSTLSDDHRKVLVGVVRDCQNEGADCVILACSELSFFSGGVEEIDVVDSTYEYAKAVLNAATGVVNG